MSERDVTQVIETEKDGVSTVTVIATDADGGSHVGTSSYEHDTWHTDSDREDAYKEATDQALDTYN